MAWTLLIEAGASTRARFSTFQPTTKNHQKSIPKLSNLDAQIDQKSKLKSIIFWLPLGTLFWSDFAGCWKENGTKLAPRWHQKSMPTSKDDLLKKLFFSWRKNNDFEGSGSWSWHQTSIKNQFKKELNLGRPLGIDFSWILVDFGGQVEPSWHRKSSQNRLKNHLKINEKKKASWRRLGSVLGRLGHLKIH